MVAEQYGYIFKIAENNLVFYDVQKLKGAKPMQIFEKSDLISINLREKTSQKYKSVQVSYFDPKLRYADVALEEENWSAKYERKQACKILEGQIAILNKLQKDFECMLTPMPKSMAMAG